MNIKVGLISLGCAKNLVDSEHMHALLHKDGCEFTDDLSEAEIAVINTCGFIEAARQEAINTILETAQWKTSGKLRGLIVTGCLAERYHEAFAQELPEVDAVLGTGSYTDIVDAVHKVLEGQRPVYARDAASAALDGDRELLTPSYTAYLKIAEGCSNQCGYCIIPQLRGAYRSRTEQSLLQEAQALCDAGVKELIVIAQDITKYGMDIDGKRHLPLLLTALCQMDFSWIRLHYLYPDQLTDELIQVIADQPKIVKYLDIPLQHASKRVLRSMHRPGSREEFLSLLAHLRAKIPGLILRTSVIVGLPGETEEEFAELCAFLQEACIERVGVFEFSPEEGTEAATLPDQIEDEIKAQRRLIVEELQSGIIDMYHESRIHQDMEVLCEGWDAEMQLYYGRTYADSVEVDGLVYFSAKHAIAPGEFVQVHIQDSLGAELTGICLEDETI